MQFTIGQVEQGVFEALRLAVVEGGYLPDIVDYLPESPTTKSAYEAAKVAIETSGKEIIEVFGVGDASSRDAITKNKIVIERMVPEKNTSIGMFGANVYVPQGDPSQVATKYNRYIAPKNIYDIEFNVFYFTKTTKYDRILDAIIRKALMKTFLNGVNDDGSTMTEVFNFTFAGGVDLSDKNFTERMFRFNAKEIMLDELVLVSRNLPQVTEFIGEGLVKIEIKPADLLP